MQKKIFNFVFPEYCNELLIFGYRFCRVENYLERLSQLQTLAEISSEISLKANTGTHSITAYVDLPDIEETAIWQFDDKSRKALSDILQLLSLFTDHDVFDVDEDFGNKNEIIVADPRLHIFGGSLRCSIPYVEQKGGINGHSFDAGLEKHLNAIYSLIRSREWQNKYDKGYFIPLACKAFKGRFIESVFVECWTIWEHLFWILNKNWLSEKESQKITSYEKIAYIMVNYSLKYEIDQEGKKKIMRLADIRNKLVHLGRFPERKAVKYEAVLFIRLTEFIIAKTLNLLPSNVYNTVEKLEEFLNNKELSKAY